MKWVKLKKYCDITGETPKSVHQKRSKGQWLDQMHCKIAPDGNLWVNIEEAEKWVESGNLQVLRNTQQVV